MNPFVRFLLVLFLGTVCSTSSAQTSFYDSLKRVAVPVEGSHPKVFDVRTPVPKNFTRLYRVDRHPALGALLTPEREDSLLREINARRSECRADMLLSSELFLLMRPYFDWLHHEDPHYRIIAQTPCEVSARKAWKLSRRLPFDWLRIGDTLLVHRSLDTLFRRGDRILSINGVTPAEYFRYFYPDRYGAPDVLMHYYFMSDAVDRFRVRFVRQGRERTVETPGWLRTKAYLKLAQAEALERNIRIFPEEKCGYLAIPKFYPVNSRLIRLLYKTLLDFRSQGLTRAVLDLRRNPGGNGDRFDELLSIFIHKPTVDYCRGQRVMVSDATRVVYPFLTDSLDGQMVDLPETEIVKSFPTLPEWRVEGLEFYVLVSRDTGSVAASFVNMLQYHGAAKLVGEPLAHHALKYGEIVSGRWFRPSLLSETAVSTVEIDEYTRAVDGTVLPDIPIPYVAADWLDGRDGMLERLLQMFREEAE